MLIMHVCMYIHVYMYELHAVRLMATVLSLQSSTLYMYRCMYLVCTCTCTMHRYTCADIYIYIIFIIYIYISYLDMHGLVSKTKPCMSKYERFIQ